jgi:hypothetical protein
MATNCSNEEKERKDGKPFPELSFVYESVCNIWNLEVDEASIIQLESYDDANFYLRIKLSPLSGENGKGIGEYLVKFYNAVESNNMEMLNGISSLLNKVSSFKEEKKNCGLLHPLVPCPILIPVKSTVMNTEPNRSSDCINFDVAFVEINSRKIGVRLFHWISGTTLNRIGKFVGK